MVNWITISSSSGNSGSTVVTVTASSYTELTARTTSLTVRTVNSNLSKNVNITQEPKEIITVTVSPTSISAPVSGGTYTFNIASNGAWTITYPSWLQVSQTSGTGNATITVTIPENESYSALTGNIVVSTADNTATVSVSQAAEEEPSRISVSPSSILNISSGGSYYVLTVTSNTGWRLTDGPSWVRFSATSGYGDTTINITVVPNSSVQRADNIIFTTTDSAATATVSLSQAGEVTPTGSTEYFTIAALENGTLNVNRGRSYSKNNAAWVTEESAFTITVSSGDTIRFRGTGNGYGLFSGNTLAFNTYGNIMSLAYEDDFADKTTGKQPNNYNLVFYSLFENCSGLNSAENLVLPVTGVSYMIYDKMFKNCTSLITAPSELPATDLYIAPVGMRLNQYEYREMFYGCSSLTTAPSISLAKMSPNCCESMFEGCTNLMSVPSFTVLTARTESCYSMFKNCTSLTTAPIVLNTNTVIPDNIISSENGAFESMFEGCSGLINAPNLPAINLNIKCYKNMFANCTGLVRAPSILPATTLASNCYRGMFSDCTNLLTTPVLPATTLTLSCYNSMFANCTSLTTAPELPATTLANNCYQYMFGGCTSLTRAPELPATTLANYCYSSMFSGCTNLNYIKCLATDISATNSTQNWVAGVASTGTFVQNPSMTGWTVDSVDGIPIGWSGPYPVGSTEYLTIECKSVISGIDANLYINNTWGTTLTIEYSLDGTNWNSITSSTSGNILIATLAKNDKVYLRGNNNNFAGYRFKTDFVSDVYGNILSLINSTDFSTMYYIPTDVHFSGLFLGEYRLQNAENLVLQATTLRSGCYMNMFAGCTSLLTAPSLPATTLAGDCYNGMFNGCSRLGYIKCLATDISASNCTDNWVDGVAATGTFVKNPSMTSWSTGVSGIPNGWTVQDAS